MPSSSRLNAQPSDIDAAMLKYLLDTNIVVHVIKRQPVKVMGLFNEDAGLMAMSSITLSDLYHGAEKSGKVMANRVADLT